MLVTMLNINILNENKVIILIICKRKLNFI